jgi:predicted nucleic acid-binding protein
MELYVDLAARLDDGEAMALAIAKARRWWLSTDDCKARRLAGDLGVKVLTTPEILKRWADAAHPAPVEIGDMLQNIERRARFAPADNDPLHGWWRRHRGAP